MTRITRNSDKDPSAPQARLGTRFRMSKSDPLGERAPAKTARTHLTQVFPDGHLPQRRGTRRNREAGPAEAGTTNGEGQENRHLTPTLSPIEAERELLTG